MKLKHIILPVFALVLLSTGEVLARRLKNEFFYNRLCSSNRYMGCCSLDEFGIRCSNGPNCVHHNPNWSCVLNKDEGAHVRYECQRLDRDQKFLVDVYSVGVGKDGKCGVHLRSEMVKDGDKYKHKDSLQVSNGILDRYLTAETTDCGETMVAPPLKRKWRHAPAAETKKFKNPIFGEYYWEGDERYTMDVRLYPDKIINYEKRSNPVETECLLIENEVGRIMYECDDLFYSILEYYGGKEYLIFELEKTQSDDTGKYLIEKSYDPVLSSYSKYYYKGYLKGRYEKNNH